VKEPTDPEVTILDSSDLDCRPDSLPLAISTPAMSSSSLIQQTTKAVSQAAGSLVGLGVPRVTPSLLTRRAATTISLQKQEGLPAYLY
jgi:hypothetical protein